MVAELTFLNVDQLLLVKKQYAFWHFGWNKMPITPQSKNVSSEIEGGVRENDNLTKGIVCDPENTTCFVESDSVVRSTFIENKVPNDYEVRYETIKDFLAKPYMLTNFQWTSATTEGQNLYSVDIGPLLTSVSAWELKTRGFEMIRGTFHMRVQVNASPFQAGRLLIHYLPNYADRVAIDPTYSSRYNYNLIQKFQHPHVELDARDAIAIISVPYISPSPYFDRKEGTYDWGRIFVDVVSPFATGAGGILNAEISIFGYWSDVTLVAPIVPQAKGFRARRGSSLEMKEESTSVSSGLRAVSSAARTLSSIPILKPVMGTVEWVSRAGSEVASIFGWSKPRVNDKPMVMLHQPLRYVGTSDGPDVSLPTSLLHDNKIETSDEFSISDQDEMSLKYLLQVPTYLGRVSWLTSNTSGTQIIGRQLSPQLMYTTITKTVGGHTYTANSGAPLYYLSNFFQYYRGSLTLHLKIVKTMFHSGKLLITYSPIINETTVPTLASSIYSLREIVDIREQSEITLNLPYMLHRPYLGVSQQIGQLRVFVLNDLRCPETCAQSVDIIYFVTAGDDFEFQVPTNLRTCGGAIYTPQSKEEVIINSGIAESQEKETSTLYSKMSIGEHFLSVKQLLNRNSVLQPRGTALTTTFSSLIVYPWFVAGLTNDAVTGLPLQEAFAADAFSLIAPMYNYFRGKSRLQIQCDNTNNLTVYNVPGLTADLGSTAFYSNIAYAFGTNTATNLSPSYINTPFQTPVPVGNNQGYAFQHIPYYNKFPVSFVNVWQGTARNYYTLDETLPSSTAVTTSATGFTNPVLSRSFADDFQLAFFIGCPPLFMSYV